MPDELMPVVLALAPMTLGLGGGGVWDPQAVRRWPERDAEDALLVIAHLSGKTGRGGRDEY